MSITDQSRPTACADPASCHLRTGQVVRFVGDQRYAGGIVRGTVETAHVREGDVITISGPVTIGDAIIRLGAGHHRVTNIHSEWEVVPEIEHIGPERLRSASLRWQRPDWLPSDDRLHEPDTWEFALVAALLTPSEHAEVFGDSDWPTSTWELLEAVALVIDERVDAVRAAGLQWPR